MKIKAIIIPVLFVSMAIAVLSNAGQGTKSEDSKVRAFITDSNSWEISGGFGEANGNGGGTVKGGARPQTAEIIKTFNERCPDVTVTMNKERADFIILLDHEGGKGYARKDNKVTVFSKDGDAIFSKSTRELGNAVKDACDAIKKHPPTPSK